MEENKIVPISIPGIHQAFWPWFLKKTDGKKIKVLDCGAGHGAFTKKLYDAGYDVSACDLFPEIFYFDKVVCQKADVTSSLPFPDSTFEAIVAMEIMEHIQDHEVFFAEAFRILKPGGSVYISTPNIMSLKSRSRFLFTGFFYSFKPLELKNYDGLQHVASLTLDQYNYLAVKKGFGEAEFSFDKRQSTSVLLSWLHPVMWLMTKIKKTGNMHNHWDLLTGRIIFMQYTKPK
ncbi:MAG: methyltransferase domain-containing protein [Bacteroidetes bacterium]|nr:methyltransferase domain-containing protein [Bacteroidota bacterium]